MNLKPARVFIFGSCVSRDAISFDTKGFVELAFYVARSSFASQGCKGWIDKSVLHNIESPFQRRMVKMDMEKSLFSLINEADFDFLIIDLIDDRFDLIEYSENCYATRSVEFLKGAKKSPVARLSHHGDAYDKYWKAGFEEFLSLLKAKGCLDKLRINEVYWACETNTGECVNSIDKDKVEVENDYLSKRYAYMRSKLPASYFFTYDSSLLKADVDHKWGVSPFHYHEIFYKSFLCKIEECAKAQEKK